MASANLLRVPRSDEKGQYVLVHVATSKGSGDITVEATEGEHAFDTKVWLMKINTYKHKQFTGNNEELEMIFKYVFQKEAPKDATSIEDIEFTGTIDKKKGLTLAIRRVIGGIKRGIAEINVPESDVEISIFDWALESCISVDSMKGKIQSYESKVESQAKKIEDLKAQLESLVTMKREHDALILLQFKKVLDDKKAKIIELSTNAQAARPSVKKKLEPELEPEPEAEPETEPKRRTTRKAASKSKSASKATSSTRRRKQPTPTPPPAPSPEEDDDATASEGEDTPNASSEDEDELPPVRKPIDFGRPIASSSKVAPMPTTTTTTTPTPIRGDETDDDDDEL